MKKIESVPCIKFSKAFSKAYGKTELVNHATNCNEKNTVQNSQNNITVEALLSGHPRDAKKVSLTGAVEV